MTDAQTLDPDRIWLSPQCDLFAQGRTWASPAPERACDDCGEPWVEYVRADLHHSGQVARGEETYTLLRDQLYGLTADLDLSVEQETHFRGRVRCYLAMHETESRGAMPGRKAVASALLDAMQEDRADWAGNLLVLGCQEANYCDPDDAAWSSALHAADAILALFAAQGEGQ